MTSDAQTKKQTLPLDGMWEFREFPESARRMRDLEDGTWLQAHVPSSIYRCLIDSGQIGEFQLNANPEDYDWVSEKSWVFRKTFDLPEHFSKQDRIQLIFEGLDTVTQIWFNEKLIGKTDNMFIPHQFDITQLIKSGPNQVMVKCLPAKQEACRRMLRYGKLSEHHFGDPCRTYLRKAQYQFGSVMGPSLPGCGIFRSFRIEAARTAAIESVHVHTIDCSQHQADIRIGVNVGRLTADLNTLTCRFLITGGGLELKHDVYMHATENHLATVIRIERPILWWPKGYGVPHLYQLKVQLLAQDGRCVDELCRDFGIRIVRLNRSTDERGNSFLFEVNEKQIYIRGANWMPLSMLTLSSATDRYENILKKCADTNINMLRVWAGGCYEDDAFYEQCDRLGILVWQDFMFASAYYPDRQWFKDAVELEAKAIIRRIASHACIALWCGNSRIDQLHEEGRLGTGRKFYGKEIYHSLLPQLVSELDPGRDYIPTTPSCRDGKKDHSPTQVQTDDYGELTSSESDKTGPSNVCRFETEFGMQSLPSLETLKSFCGQPELYLGSARLEKHNYQPGSIGRLSAYAAEYFAPPKSLQHAIWQTQVVQARCLKRHIEHLRTNRQANSGALIWTLNDSAAAISFSLFDYLQRPKAAAYYAKQFFAPVLVTITEDPVRSQLKTTLINDGPGRITATLLCRLLNLKGNVLDETQMPVTVSPFSISGSLTLPKSFSAPHAPNQSFLNLRLISDEKTIAENVYFFCPDKHIAWPAAEFDMKIEPLKQTNQWIVEFNSGVVVRDLQVIPPQQSECSDNFLTLLPGRPQKIIIQFAGTLPVPQTPLQFISSNQHSLS